jgi:hypothetical protein
MLTQRVATQLECRLDELLYFLRGHDVGDGPRPFLATKNGYRHFVLRIFEPGETCEANDVANPTCALMHCSRQSCPFDGRFPANVDLTSCISESGESE